MFKYILVSQVSKKIIAVTGCITQIKAGDCRMYSVDILNGVRHLQF